MRAAVDCNGSNFDVIRLQLLRNFLPVAREILTVAAPWSIKLEQPYRVAREPALPMSLAQGDHEWVTSIEVWSGLAAGFLVSI